MDLKILTYSNRKIDPVIYDISTPEKELAAYLLLFQQLDKDWQCYSDLDEIEVGTLYTACPPCLARLHEDCREDGCYCTAAFDCQRRSRSSLQQANRELEWKKLCDAARLGDPVAAKTLLTERSKQGYEYEEIRLAEVIDPLDEVARLAEIPNL